jgi:hypothetical protein
VCTVSAQITEMVKKLHEITLCTQSLCCISLLLKGFYQEELVFNIEIKKYLITGLIRNCPTYLLASTQSGGVKLSAMET